MGLADLVSTEYKITLKGKPLGLIKWDDAQWNLSGVPNAIQQKLKATKVGLLSTEELEKGVRVLRVKSLTPKDPLWAFQLIKTLAIEGSPIQLVPVSKVSSRGGPGSGFFGHLGRPGLRGGSRKSLVVRLAKHLQKNRDALVPQIKRARTKINWSLGRIPEGIYAEYPVKKVTLATSHDFFEKQFMQATGSKSYAAALRKAFQEAKKAGITKAKNLSEYEKEEYNLFMKYFRIVGSANKTTNEIMIDVAAPRLDFVMLHEYGHLVDFKKGFSSTPFWRVAVSRDFEGLAKALEKTYGSLELSELRALEDSAESFAEAFSLFFKNSETRYLLREKCPEMSSLLSAFLRPWEKGGLPF